MKGTRAVGSWDPLITRKGGSTLRKKVLLIGLLAAVAVSATAFGFDAFFADANGNKIGTIWEGGRFYVVVYDPDKGACGIDQFEACVRIFDFKTGAYISTRISGIATFREFTAGSGLYFWVDDAGNKRAIKVGDRAWTTGTVPQWTHILGDSLWVEGAWEYVDQDVLGDTSLTDATTPVNTGITSLPQNQATARVDFEGAKYSDDKRYTVQGRFENMDTLVLIVADRTDERNIDQDQVKIIDTVATLTVNPTTLEYGCGAVCDNITVTINDPDENLDCDKIDYVPFFVIINPGAWNPEQTHSATNFCMLKMFGGVDPSTGASMDEPIRWYNIYDKPYTANGITSRFIDYPNDWFSTTNKLPVVFFAHETDVDSGVFEFNFGNLEDFMKALGLNPDVTGDRFEPGTTIAFYYLDPNDFDDFTLTTAVVGDRPHSETYITDANGVPVEVVKIGYGGLYVRVYDADANINACCQDKVVVHLCDPHNEDDSEYWVIDEVSNDSGIFGSMSGMPLLPVWDAVGGYQLVFDNWKFEAFNEDTIYARYNSVDYHQESLNALGDGNPNDTVTIDNTTYPGFPPRIDTTADRNQVWDVSFDLVKVYDYQVFDGETHHMRFLNGAYEPVSEIPVSGSLYLEVTDLDQNENSGLRELVFGGWNKDAFTGDDDNRSNSGIAPWWPGAGPAVQPANEDTAPVWWKDSGDSSEPLSPWGALPTSPELKDLSISGIPETVKVFIWNAQRGTWERMDLRETAVGSGIFRSTTCVVVAGDGTSLNSKPGDTIIAFYQDPSNHSDVATIQIKVSEGGAVGVTPPTAQLAVAFDAATYNPGDTVVITVTDSAYAGAGEIAGTDVLVLKDANGAVIQSWDSIPSVDTNEFQVSYELPEDVALGTITAVYTDPVIASRTAEATAQVVAAELSDVTGISVSPNPFAASTTFSIVAVPEGAVADELTVAIYDLTGKKVAELAGSATASVSWDGGALRNGAYIYVAVVKGAGKVWTFRGFVYIKR